MADIHAKTCSPSGASGWFACPGRIVMESEFPDQDTDYSSDGTARHTVCAFALGRQGAIAKYVGWWVDTGDTDVIRDEEPAQAIGKLVQYRAEWADEDQDYVDTVRSLAEGGELFVERVVNFETYTRVKGDSFGTADAIVLRPIQVLKPGADGVYEPSGETTYSAYELIIVDRKTGYVEVEVERNKQLMLYALGALAEFGMVYDIARVRLVIHQRKAREWDCSIDELLQFGTEARSRAASVQNAIQMHGKVDAYKWNATFLNPNPSEDACRYCKAMATCPSMRAKVEALVSADFEQVDGNLSKTDIALVGAVNDDHLATQMAAVGLIEDWCKAVRAETERRLLAGKPVPGFKLVLGKQGNRAWSDKTAAEKMLREQFRLPIEVAYDLSVISPTTAEKLTKGDKPAIGPRQWKKAQELITRSEPKPSVAPVSDKREAWTPPNAADDFAPISEEAGLELV